ncbi:hypothetical protein CC1G_13508 [Coprinopsis cinerea okayama7|uniref:Uncharacterized protein n=1 Tax=Coprinopsis cinerea (strain Okayama-7 / 130 / ATCC MYA-4618 / FGSC 9003) TaxID=240176 RepID=A8PJ30_COPC7|nr:hypothetical protein CC1G_13508 [Coprinopsis cinerea okayama7\|eukprot:XP_001841657.1 hypothetical protein CC1G_13508 [Coprinopsis cinerea okayama7\
MGYPAKKGDFIMFWNTSLTQLRVADPTVIDPQWHADGLRTSPLCLATGASITLDISILPRTCWALRLLIFTSNHNLPTGTNDDMVLDNPIDTSAAQAWDQLGNFYWKTNAYPYIPGVISPPFAPFRKARALLLDTAQDLYRTGTPSVDRVCILSDRVHLIRNDSTKIKHHHINQFVKLKHYLSYESMVTNGQQSLRPQEASRPINVLIIAHPKDSDGMIKGPPPPVTGLDDLETDPRPELEMGDEPVDKDYTLDPTMMQLEAEMLSVDTALENVERMIRLLEPSRPVDDVAEGSSQPRQTRAKEAVRERNERELTELVGRRTRLQIQRESIRERIRVYTRRTYKPTLDVNKGKTADILRARNDALPVAVDQHGSRLPSRVNSEPTLPGQRRFSQAPRESTPFDPGKFDSDDEAEGDDEKTPQQKYDDYMTKVGEVKPNMPFGFSAKVSTRLWFYNIRRAIGLVYR